MFGGLCWWWICVAGIVLVRFRRWNFVGGRVGLLFVGGCVLFCFVWVVLFCLFVVGVSLSVDLLLVDLSLVDFWLMT